MKSLPYYLLHACFIVTLIACNPKQSNETRIKSLSLNVSDNYQAPVFENDNRVEKIKSIEPEIQRLIEEHAKANNIPGIAYGIVVDKKLVIASATGMIGLDNERPATPKSSFRIASMTKSFTAMAILKLRDEGKLSLSDPVSKYIPEMSGIDYLTSDSPIIDIENLLTMTSGLPEDNPWGDRQLDESDQMLIGLIREGVSFSNTSSHKFEYSNTGYTLLGNIVSRVSGIPYQSYIKENILQPLGMEHTRWEFDSIPKEHLAIGYRWEDEKWKPEPLLHDGAFGAMGGLITSIEDFSAYVSLHLSAWPPRNGKDTGPVKRSTLREMQTPQFSSLSPDAMDFKGDPCAVISGYGYGLNIAQDCNGLKLVTHGGALPGFGSNYIFFPEYGIGMMAFGNLTYTTPWPVKEIAKLLFKTNGIQPRVLPVSSILAKRQDQVAALIQHWDPALEKEILAENFYLDKSRESRISEIQEVLDKAGDIQEIEKMEPDNQLRGSFKLQAKNGTINIFFTLTPEKSPKVQQLGLSFQPKKAK